MSENIRKTHANKPNINEIVPRKKKKKTKYEEFRNIKCALALKRHIIHKIILGQLSKRSESERHDDGVSQPLDI